MGPPSRRRGSVALAAVAVLLAAAALVALATARYRGQVSRRVARLEAKLAGLHLAEAALAELASQPRIDRVFATAGARDAVLDALRGGTRTGLSVRPAPRAIPVTLELADPGTAATGRVTGAELRLLRYTPGSGRGLLRAAVTVAAPDHLGGRVASYAHDYEVRAARRDIDGFTFRIARAPKAKVYP